MGSRILAEFEHSKPSSIEESTSLLQKYGDEASILAGGTDLFALMKRIGIKPKYVVDLTVAPSEMGLRVPQISEKGYNMTCE